MSESGFERRLREESEQRRRLREQGADDKLQLDADEKQQIRDSLAQLLDDEDLTEREFGSWCREIVSKVRSTKGGQLTTEQIVQVLHGGGLPLIEERRRPGEMSNERFLEQLQSGPEHGVCTVNRYGGTF
jgi:hypothetical protein